MTMKRLFPALALAAIAIAPACNRNKSTAPSVSTMPVTRRDIIIDAQANGVVEPINVVEVKSKASGLITRMNVETGSLVRPGELLAQIDTRDVQNQYNQAVADERAAEARLQVADAQKKRSDEMFRQRVITAQEHETAALDYANAQAAAIRARASTDLAKQRLEDATVTSPVAGTVIERTVSQGMVITGATGNSATGGTTLMKMADLTRVRMRAQFNETDIGQIRAGQPAVVIVDAYPDRRFQGLVEKIEPQAVVQQGVTMFPVLVTLANMDGALKPGMNGEVQVQIDQRLNVLAVPNDAVKNVREAMATAPLLGLDPDSVQAQMRAQFGGRGGNGGGNGGATAGPGGQRPAGGPAATPQGRVTNSPGEVELPQQGQGGFQMPEVTDKDCAAVTAAMQKKPAEAKKLDGLRDRMRSGELDRAAMREESQKIYAALGVDARIAGACRMREGRGGQASQGAPNAGLTAPPGGQPAANARRADASQGATQPQLQIGNAERGRGGRSIRSGLVFVAKGKTFEPRMVMLGAGNFDYTEVISGLQEGEEVAMLAALSLQAQRQQTNDRIRQNMGGGVPGMSAPGGGGGAQGGQRPGGGR
ncbi:MAG TPA: efflux RND transporter periplasmic adaptor subunit [Gemmatimonadaceae bacterium]|nr:efflux RND transporter periplasmic adaptor subunit [Gemmatimonadaceae bacterium]